VSARELGRDVYDWQDVQIKVKDRHAVIYLNGKQAYEETYREDFGKIVALIYIFDGTGSIDFAKLTDGQQRVVLEDDFDN
jgi:hypothetical protein